MTYVISFYGYQPVPRYDNESWTNVRIEEAATTAGPWASLETQAMVADADPSHPQTRNITTTQATLLKGWYRLTFIDGSAHESQTTPVFHGPAHGALASLADIKRVMKLGTTDATTDAQLLEALDVANAILKPKIQTFDISAGTGYHFHVVQGSYLPLEVNDANVSEVRAYVTPDGDPIILNASQYQIGGAPRSANTAVLLERETWGASWPHGFDDHLDQSTPAFARVEIDWTYTDGVPKPVRDAIAMTAGALWSQGPKYISGLKSETIGDYSYTFDGIGKAESLVPSAALDLISQYRARMVPFVT